MLLFVYALRDGPRLLSAESILSRPPVYGRLVLRDSGGIDMVNLYDKEAKDIIAPLIEAKVKRINMGMHLVGIEQQGRAAAKAKVMRFKQSWLCAAEVSVLEPLVRMLPKPPTSFPGFDPADDDRED